jgi:hypothetical protein
MNGRVGKGEPKWSELRDGVRTLQLSGIVRLRDAMGTGEILVSQRYVAAGSMLLPGIVDWELKTTADPTGDMLAEMQMSFDGHGLRLDGQVFLMRANAGGRSIYTGVGPLNGLKEAGLLPPD